MKILLINHAGEGFVGPVDIEGGLSMRVFLERQLPQRAASEPERPASEGASGSPTAFEGCVIRVNYRRVGADYVLQEGDRVTITCLDPPRAA